MRRLFLASLSFFLLSPMAQAADCTNTDFATAFQAANSVFVGKIKTIDAATHVAAVRANYVFKGLLWKDRSVQVPADIVRNPDDNILFYTSRAAAPGGNDVVDTCSHTAPLDQAPEFTLLLFVSFAGWIGFLIILRVMIFFSRKRLGDLILPLFGRGSIVFLLLIILWNFLSPDLHLSYVYESLAAPFVVSVFLCMFLLLPRQIAAPIQKVSPYVIAACLFLAANLILIVLFQPATALILSAAGILLCDSWRHRVKQNTDIRMSSLALGLLTASVLLFCIDAGMLFQRWSS